jgi:ribosomal protein S18 acetylase RimI-like enzyme
MNDTIHGRIAYRAFETDDADSVVALWARCGLLRDWNDPRKDISRKLRVNPEWFLVAADGPMIVGTVMAGYDGHRGWVNYLAVEPGRRGQGIARGLMNQVEKRLRDAGCPKINLQIRESNTQAVAFYEAIGYRLDPVLSMGKRLIEDQPPSTGGDS